MSKILVGWEDVNEEDGTPISFSKGILKEFAEDTDFVAAVLAAFRKFYANAQLGKPTDAAIYSASGGKQIIDSTRGRRKSIRY